MERSTGRTGTGRRRILLALSLLCAVSLSAGSYPLVKDLSRTDHLYRQLAEDVAAFYQAYFRGNEIPPLMFYEYVVKEGEDIYGIAARINISASSIATLNGTSSPGDLAGGDRIILPNQKGIFIAAKPKTELEHLMHSWRGSSFEGGITVRALFAGETREFVFLPGEDFHRIELSYFLGILFRYPLTIGTISSGYGGRKDPFSGHYSFHNGIDIAAPQGTEVIAAREGVVSGIGEDPILGIYVMIAHGGGYSTVYGHLSKRFVELKQTVHSGMIVGEVGATGLTTGPHLHFEIRRGETPQDPLNLLRDRRP